MSETPRVEPLQVECIIFDLDDTLIETCRFYNDVRNEVFEKLRIYGFDITDAEKHLEAIELVQIKKLGFAKERFPTSLGLLYSRLCEDQGHRYQRDQHDQIEAIGWSVYTREHPVLGDAEMVLGALRYAGYKLICMTKGDVEVQTLKLDRSGLGEYFHHVEVVPDKTPKQYQGLVEIYNLTPQLCFMVGDSIKSDINPSAAVGMLPIHIPQPNGWSYENVPAEYPYAEVAKLEDLLDLFNARWAVDLFYAYRAAPHQELLRAARDGKVRMMRDDAVQELMPDCPGTNFRFMLDQDEDSMLEYRAVFSATEDTAGLPRYQQIPDQQLSCAGYNWPGGQTIEQNMDRARAIRECVALALCSMCSNQHECTNSGIHAGIRQIHTSSVTASTPVV